MNHSDEKREVLTKQLEEHGLGTENWETLDELRRKLSAAKAMDLPKVK